MRSDLTQKLAGILPGEDVDIAEAALSLNFGAEFDGHREESTPQANDRQLDHIG